MVTKLGVILRETTNTFESKGVLNPAVLQSGSEVKMFYRAFKEGNFSTLGYCRFDGPLDIVERKNYPVFLPDRNEEKLGVEDARLVKIENTCYLTYTAYDCNNALGSITTSKDLITFNKLGVITPKVTFNEYMDTIHTRLLNSKYVTQYSFLVEHGMMDKVTDYLVWDKNLLLFPEKINGEFVLLHRLFPGIQIVRFKDFNEFTNEFWLKYLRNLDRHIVMDPKFWYETSHIGGGCPPIKTSDGWLLIYHAVEVATFSNIYHVSAALLDLDDPQKVLYRLKEPLMSPEEDFEKYGYVNNVCFPTGTSLFNDDLYIYYGAADNTIAVAKLNIKELIDELVTNNASDL